MTAPLYLDYAASTPVAPAVVSAMTGVLADPAGTANPSSGHAAGRAARARVEAARRTVAAAVGADPAGLVWTGGATEADNLAVIGGARLQRQRGRGHRVVTVATEHQAVLAAVDVLEGEGFAVTRLLPDADGRLPPERLAGALDEDVALVSVMHVNNETGVIQDIPALGELARGVGALMHVDAAQSVGRGVLDLAAWPVDLVSLSAQKAYGPKGVGALWLRRRPRARVRPLIVGGGQEQGLRGGTVATHQVVGMAEAFRLAVERRDADADELHRLRHRLWAGLAGIGGLILNGRTDGAAHILNVSVLGVHGDALRDALDGELAVSAGSACATGGSPSHVLRAMGRPDALAGSALRLSIGRGLTMADIDRAVERLATVIAGLRRVSPVWRALGEGRSIGSLYGTTDDLPEVA